MLLQQLVDGELDDRQYREVLGELAEEADGWQRCALAFLEDQALRREIPEWRDERAAWMPAPQPGPSRAARRVSPALLLLAMAASFLLAFTLGYKFNLWPRLGGASQSADSQRQASGSQGMHLANPEGQDLRDDAWGGIRSVPLGAMTLVVDGPDGADGQRIDVPVYPLTPSTSELLVESQSAVPPALFEALRLSGREVRTQHFWAPVTLEDGRQIVIPVEQVEIVPATRSVSAY
jgi:hypothetical protein